MCGIAGVFSCVGRHQEVERMADAVSHRGPDDSGIAELRGNSGQLRGAFGHRRLSIIDLSSAGHQPMLRPESGHSITYNGEIYNHHALRSELASRGVIFRGQSDTEVLLAGWAGEGHSFIRKLRGMFAFALWDARTETGYLVRDRFGIKPLYVAERDGDVFFASEVRSILASGRVARRLDACAIRSYLATGSVAEPHTIIEGVFAIPPGCIVPVTRDGERFCLGPPTRFATAFPETVEPDDPGTLVPRVRAALRDSVAHHLVSDVPIAVFLSGGIDSAAITGLASEVSEKPLETFTVIFREDGYNEAVEARATARRFGTMHHEVPLSGVTLLGSIPDAFRAMDQPSLDGLNTFVVSRAVRDNGLKVVLSGLGGDELFGGYPSFRRTRAFSWLWKLPASFRTAGAVGLSAMRDPRAERAGVLLRSPTPASGAYDASRSLFTRSQISVLLGDGLENVCTHGVIERTNGHHRTGMQQISQLEVTGYMLNTLLRDSDVFSMAHALELRVPYVDEHVVAIAYEAAAHEDFKRGLQKPFLVEAVRDLLSPQILAVPKSGFTLPFEQWLRNDLRHEVSAVLEHGLFATDLGLRPESVSRVWQDFVSGKPWATWSRPWSLYTLIRWVADHGAEMPSMPSLKLDAAGRAMVS